jgi:hypothetical protein
MATVRVQIVILTVRITLSVCPFITATGEQVFGKEEKLGELVYKFNTEDQADMYLRTTEAIANFVDVEYGRDMRMLVKHGTEKTFAKPRISRSKDATPGLMEKYKTELGIFH